MSILIRMQLVFVVSLALPANGSACSCYVRPLAERYESASVVLVAKIGEQRDSYEPSSGAIVRSWSFDALEVLKGDVDFDELVTSSCGGHLLEGGKYLIFTGNDGEVDSCRSGELSLNARYRADLELLRERRMRGLETLAEPWVFDKRDGVCSLSLDMFNGGSLRFEYRFADAVTGFFEDQQFRYDPDEHRTVKLSDAGRHPAGLAGFRRVSVWYPNYDYKVAETGRLTIGGSDWSTQHQAMEGPFPPFEVVADSAFSEVLSAVIASEGAWLSAEYRYFPYNQKEYPDFPEIKAWMPHYYRGTALQRFQECIAQAGQ